MINGHNYLFIVEVRKRKIEREENKQYELRSSKFFSHQPK